MKKARFLPINRRDTSPTLILKPRGVVLTDRPIFIRIAQTKVSFGISEIWKFRELLYFFTWRDLKVRYKQTILGGLWAILQPVLSMVVFSVFFGKLAKIPSDNIPYPVFTYAALVPWTMFSNGVSQSAMSLVSSSNLLRKIYFPRILVPLASILSSVVDFVIAFIVLILMMLWFHVAFSWRLITIPFLILLLILTALGTGFWLSALNVKFRDIRYVVPFLTQFWLFATPVAYPSSLLPAQYRIIYGLNPMAGIIEGFRWALLGTTAINAGMLAVSSSIIFCVLWSGLYYFRKMERSFADIV